MSNDKIEASTIEVKLYHCDVRGTLLVFRSGQIIPIDFNYEVQKDYPYLAERIWRGE